jgi:hypothetical protein
MRRTPGTNRILPGWTPMLSSSNACIFSTSYCINGSSMTWESTSWRVFASGRCSKRIICGEMMLFAGTSALRSAHRPQPRSKNGVPCADHHAPPNMGRHNLARVHGLCLRVTWCWEKRRIEDFEDCDGQTMSRSIEGSPGPTVCRTTNA